MDEKYLMKTIREMSRKLPKFTDGRIDYSKSKMAPVLSIFVKQGKDILLLKRSSKVGNYKEKWSTVNGYLDEIKPIEEKVFEELEEEIGITKSMISSIDIKELFKFKDENLDKVWLIYPVIVELKEKTKIKLDFEHTDFKWVRKEDIRNFDTIPNVCIISDNLFNKK